MDTSTASVIHEYCKEDGEQDQEENNKNDDDDDDVPLPGFRFHPTDEELVGFYLKRKVDKRPISIELIKQIDIYKFDPWDLPKASNVGDKEWYFFCKRGRKYRNSIRPNRVTGSGFWKATGIDRPIYSAGGHGRDCIGLKKSLVYYRGSAGKGTKTDWMMHEFRLPSQHDTTSNTNNIHHPKNNIALEDAEVWTLCRIFKRNVSYRKCIPPEWKELSGVSTGAGKAQRTNNSNGGGGVDAISSKTCSMEFDHDDDHQSNNIISFSFSSAPIPNPVSLNNHHHTISNNIKIDKKPLTMMSSMNNNVHGGGHIDHHQLAAVAPAVPLVLLNNNNSSSMNMNMMNVGSNYYSNTGSSCFGGSSNTSFTRADQLIGDEFMLMKHGDHQWDELRSLFDQFGAASSTAAPMFL